MYRHTQFGFVTCGALFAAIVGVSSSVLMEEGSRSVSIVVVTVLVVCLLLFPTLTTRVDAERVRCHFGVGLVRREIALSDVASVRVVRNSWLHGWGLRLIPGGVLWSVSGLDAVELKLRSGRVFRIGTDQPNDLHRAITDRLLAAG